MNYFFFAGFFFGGRPRWSLPAGTSQFGCLQCGQLTGRPAIRFTQA